MSGERRRYLVERISRCVVEVEVEAYSLAEARTLADSGVGEELDSRYESKGTGKARLVSPFGRRQT